MDGRSDRHPKFNSHRQPDHFDVYNSIFISIRCFKQPLGEKNYSTVCKMLRDHSVKNNIFLTKTDPRERLKKIIISVAHLYILF